MKQQLSPVTEFCPPPPNPDHEFWWVEYEYRAEGHEPVRVVEVARWAGQHPCECANGYPFCWYLFAMSPSDHPYEEFEIIEVLAPVVLSPVAEQRRAELNAEGEGQQH